MDTSSWKTHCFGRFLIDLPSHAEVDASYSIWNRRIWRLNDSPSAVMREIDSKEAELKSSEHKMKGSMFVRRQPLGDESIGLISWGSPHSEAGMWLDAYIFSRSNVERHYGYSGLFSSSRESDFIDFVRRLSNSVYGLMPNYAVKEPGFCLDGGYISGNEFMGEGFNVAIRLPEHPGMTISFESNAGAEEDTLLERVGGFFRMEILGRVTGINTLRKRRRQVNGYRGEEFLVAGTQRGYRAYAFKWEFQGKDRSLSEPHLTLELDVSDYDPDGDDPPPPPAFQSDREALQLWDAILNSIRLRPGAV